MEEPLRYRERKRATEKVYTRKEVADMLKEKERLLQANREDLKSAYEEILLLKKQAQALKEKLEGFESPSDGYRKEWTWVRKIVFVLERAGKPLRSPEIIEVLAKKKEHLRNHWNQAQYFSAFLHMALKSERVKREKRKGERGFYYFLP